MNYKTMEKYLKMGFVCGRGTWDYRRYLVVKGFIFKKIYDIEYGKVSLYKPTQDDLEATDWMVVK